MPFYQDACNQKQPVSLLSPNSLPASIHSSLAANQMDVFGFRRSCYGKLARRKRLYEDDIRDLTRAMLERGFVLIDMDGFFVVMSANTFVNYRRANEDVVA